MQIKLSFNIKTCTVLDKQRANSASHLSLLWSAAGPPVRLTSFLYIISKKCLTVTILSEHEPFQTSDLAQCDEDAK